MAWLELGQLERTTIFKLPWVNRANGKHGLRASATSLLHQEEVSWEHSAAQQHPVCPACPNTKRTSTLELDNPVAISTHTLKSNRGQVSRGLWEDRVDTGVFQCSVQTCCAQQPSTAAEGELFDLYLFCLYYLSRVNKCRYKYQALQTIHRFITLAAIFGFHASASRFIKLHYNPLNNDNTLL